MATTKLILGIGLALLVAVGVGVGLGCFGSIEQRSFPPVSLNCAPSYSKGAPPCSMRGWTSTASTSEIVM